MKRKALFALALLPLLTSFLTGCVIYEEEPHWHHPHGWYYR